MRLTKMGSWMCGCPIGGIVSAWGRSGEEGAYIDYICVCEHRFRSHDIDDGVVVYIFSHNRHIVSCKIHSRSTSYVFLTHQWARGKRTPSN